MADCSLDIYPSDHEVHNYINGVFVPPVNGNYFDNVKPHTGENWCKIPESDKSDIDAAVEAAEVALPAWKALGVPGRAKVLRKIADVMEKHHERLAILEMTDKGTNWAFAFNVDIARTINNFRFFASYMETHTGELNQAPGMLNYTSREPCGIVGLITPWNLPSLLSSFKIAPAMICGNTMVLKPSNITPMTAYEFGKMFTEAGVPPGVINIVQGAGAECGGSLVEHPKVSAISFTGGDFVGKIIGANCGRLFKKVQLELGGKNPGIVFDDCDFDQCISQLTKACFSNQGQVCLTIERLFVHRSIFDKLITAWKKHLEENLVIGDPKTSNFGSLVGEFHRTKVEEAIEEAKQLGGKIEFGGKRPENLPAPFCNGAYVMPTIVTGLEYDSKVCCEEVFGPFVCVIPFDTEEEVVKMCNHVNVGLASSIWTTNLNRAHRVSAQLEVGMVWVNDWCLRDLRVPFGGVKHSGIGREGGRYSIDFYSRAKNICINLNEFKA